jgi:DNA-binding transcriptional regulator YiaG
MPTARAASPTPDAIRAWRRERNLSAAQAGALVHTTCRVWQQWEAGERKMHPAFWELARRKAMGS